MNEKNINPKAILLARLAEEDLQHLVNFDCNDEEMNRFLKEEAYKEQCAGLNNTILLYYKGDLAAFCSVCCDSIPLSNQERSDNFPPYKIPAIKLARLGRHHKYKDYGFGKRLVEYVKNMAYELSQTQIGVRFITLDAYPERVKFYRDLDFTENEKVNQGNRTTISMRADIFD